MSRRFQILLGLGLIGAGALAFWFWRGRDASLDAVEAAVRQAYPEVPVVSTDALAAALADSSRAPLLLDAREPREFAVSHLPGARQIAPDAEPAELAEALGEVPRDREIVVYCSVGYRSAGIAERLRVAGFANVANLEGSIFRWANEGRPVVREGEPARLVHPYNATWGRLLAPERRAPLTD
ncbi:MAG TPA: rhodanese-like domain-containing protein [Bacteroidetes bacterium]|nr:rhodanese-like domain-containing protein [Bacteroidota bacterium]HIL57625.1 rhodanese-like domain-containing protein [Rhodothermales bacterium]